MDRDRLIRIVTEEVARRLAQRSAAPSVPVTGSDSCPRKSAPSGPGPIFLFSGAVRPTNEIWQACSEAAQGAGTPCAVVSHSFLDHTDESEVATRLAGAAIHTPRLAERQLLRLVEAHRALLIPALSPNTAAKAALGIYDSEPSQLLRIAIQTQTPVVALDNLLNPDKADCPMALARSAPPTLKQTVNSHRLALERMGVRFTCIEDFPAAARCALAPPEEFPRVLPGPISNRDFVTEVDLRDLKLRGETTRLIGPLTVVTDAAREFAQREGIDLIRTSE